MNRIYKLVAINDASREFMGRQNGVETCDITLDYEKPCIIGRSVNPDGFTLDPKATHCSNRHCKIEYSQDNDTGWLITNTSTNGTFIRKDDDVKWIPLPKGEACLLPEGWQVRLSKQSHGGSAKLLPLIYEFNSVLVEEEQEVADSGEEEELEEQNASTSAAQLPEDGAQVPIEVETGNGAVGKETGTKRKEPSGLEGSGSDEVKENKRAKLDEDKAAAAAEEEEEEEEAKKKKPKKDKKQRKQLQIELQQRIVELETQLSASKEAERSAKVQWQHLSPAQEPAPGALLGAITCHVIDGRMVVGKAVQYDSTTQQYKVQYGASSSDNMWVNTAGVLASLASPAGIHAAFMQAQEREAAGAEAGEAGGLQAQQQQQQQQQALQKRVDELERQLAESNEKLQEESKERESALSAMCQATVELLKYRPLAQAFEEHLKVPVSAVLQDDDGGGTQS